MPKKWLLKPSSGSETRFQTVIFRLQDGYVYLKQLFTGNAVQAIYQFKADKNGN